MSTLWLVGIPVQRLAIYWRAVILGSCPAWLPFCLIIELFAFLIHFSFLIRRYVFWICCTEMWWISFIKAWGVAWAYDWSVAILPFFCQAPQTWLFVLYNSSWIQGHICSTSSFSLKVNLELRLSFFYDEHVSYSYLSDLYFSSTGWFWAKEKLHS